MPGLFEQFPHTNLHELNLDWIIDLINQFKQELEDSAVLSVNGQTGHVTLYESENVVLPPLTEASSWRLVRMMDGQYVGVLFQDGHVWLQQGNSTLKLLTTEDIPTSAGVVSINGLGGIVRLTGADIPIDNSADPDSIRLALETVDNKTFQGYAGSDDKNPDNYTNIGYYYNTNWIYKNSTVTGYLAVLPRTESNGIVSGFKKQILSNYNNNNVSVRTQYDSGNGIVWTDWQELATYEHGLWIPHLCDLTTEIRELRQGEYFKIGNFVFAILYAENPDLSGISTMMQIRNVPMNMVMGGSFYLAGLDGAGGNHTIQASPNSVYFRPNITSALISNPTSPGLFSLIIFGIV